MNVCVPGGLTKVPERAGRDAAGIKDDEKAAMAGVCSQQAPKYSDI